MPVSTLPSAQEYEENGWATVEFVGIRYVGPESTKIDRDIRRRGGYAGPPKFQRGRVYFALVPTWLDAEHIQNANIGAHAIEARSDFEVIYDAERLARALLARNYLPADVFYEGFDRWKRRKVMEKLGLKDAGRVFGKDDEEPYREQLRELAGVEEDEEAAVSQQRAEQYARRFSRGELQQIVAHLQEGPAVDPPFDPGQCTIDELEARLETDEDRKWDTETLRALLAVERDGKNRTGAVEAIEAVLGGDAAGERGGEIDLETAGLTGLAEYLTRFGPETVENAIDDALGEE